MSGVLGFDRHYILYQLPCIEGWAWYAWSIEHNGVTAMQLQQPGYIAQHAQHSQTRPTRPTRPIP